MENLEKFLTPELTVIILTGMVLPLLRSITKFITSLISAKIDEMQEKIESVKINNYIDRFEDIVITSVDAVTQSFVDSLKKSNSFDDTAKKEAFNMAKSRALSIMTDEGKLMAQEIYGDIDIWLDNKIENYIKNSKR